ncbi:MAG TPA: NUDIX domain-containing protein [Rhizomicrobium sp.]|jgi:ADP-ribose pyrophosphatase YjhB (NUDIX family)|nr:NUDIX domain-containing protein [Rhizomicrobium sp.]
MRERPTVRVLLVSPAKRLLLFRAHNHELAGAPATFWSTAGGGREGIETIQETAIREIREETGICDVVLGPVVWYGENVLSFPDFKAVFLQHYIVAYAATEALDHSGWTIQEQRETAEARWWSLAEIHISNEVIYPTGLADLLAPILDSIYPPTPIYLLRM